jgi:hypothetical protein
MTTELERDQTIGEWCARKNFSRSFYNKLQRMGLGPHVTEIIVPGDPGICIKRITVESAREWDARMAAYQHSVAGKLEAERRRKLLSKAGKASAESPNHHKVGKAKAKRRTLRRRAA